VASERIIIVDRIDFLGALAPGRRPLFLSDSLFEIQRSNLTTSCFCFLLFDSDGARNIILKAFQSDGIASANSPDR
jgi:hypothetical protein